MADLVYTIDDEDNVAIESEQSSDEELTVASSRERERKKLESKGFNPSFNFEIGNDDTSSSIESALKAALKQKKSRSTVDQKINEIRSKRLTAEKLSSKPHEVEANQHEDVDDFIDDDDNIDEELICDKLKVVERRRKRKKQLENVDETFSIPFAKVEDPTATEKAVSWDPDLTFQEMNISRPLLKAISAMNYVTPTPIQQAAIPVALMGRDVCACAATGTGKTAAFMLPVLERLLYRPSSSPVTRVLCLVPTRELAVQVFTVTQQLAQHSTVRICLAAGGMDIKSQEASLRQNPDIVIATPGRLIDHLHNAPSFELRSIEILILDEADRMLDEYFEEQMKEVIRMCAHQRQTMLFSATLSDQVQNLASVSLKNPVRIFVNSNTDVAPFLRQEFIRIRANKEGDREAIVAALCSRSFISNVLVFTQTKKSAHRMHIVLGLLGIKAAELHGDLSQSDRLRSLKKFKDGEADVLVCTDLASRGLDIENVKTVINLTMPNSQQHYVHRVGRTARAGRSGRSVSLVGESERKLLKEIVKFAKNPVKSRVVPAEVIAKFSAKMSEIEKEVGEVISMELQEKRLLSTENQVKKAEKLVNGETPDRRNWFQGKIERQLSRAEKMLGVHSEAGKKNKGKQNIKWMKGKKAPTLNADDRMKAELAKSQEFQRRQHKRANKPKRARACAEGVDAKRQKRGGDSTQKRKKSFFDSELTNTSKKSVNKFRATKNRSKKRK